MGEITIAENDLAERVRGYGSFLERKIERIQESRMRAEEGIANGHAVFPEPFKMLDQQFAIYAEMQRKLYEIFPEPEYKARK